MNENHVGETLKIVHDGSVTVMKSGGVILGKQALEEILYKALGLDETSYSETLNAVVTITIAPKSLEPMVGWVDADE